LLRIEPRELVKRFIQRQQVNFRLLRQLIHVVIDTLCCPSPPRFTCLVLARVVHQYAPHQLRGDSEKMGAILPFRISLIDEL
jgi:hypothetical protein